MTTPSPSGSSALGEHAEAVTELLVRDVALSEVEIDEFVRFVLPKAA